MSYVNNVLATIRQMVSCEPPAKSTGDWRMKRTRNIDKVKTKLHNYLVRAGATDYSEKSPLTMENLNVGWAGRKTKLKLVERQFWSKGVKAPKVRRTVIQADDVHRFMWSITANRAIAQTEEVQLPRWDYMVLVRNHKVGSVTFYSDRTGPVLKIDWKRDLKASEADIRKSWHVISQEYEDGSYRPFVRLLSRRITVVGS